MALVDDMLTDSSPIDVPFKDRTYRVYYRPLALTDDVKAKLDDMVTKLVNSTTGDLTGVDPLLLALVADWEFDQIKKNADGRPLAVDGSLLTDRSSQAPAIERLPVSAEGLGKLASFLKLAIATAISNDAAGSAGNARGTSDSIPPGAASAPGVPGAGAAPTPVPSSSNGQNPTTTAQPALVTVPSLESRESTT